MQDIDGYSDLHKAAVGGNDSWCETLLRNGAFVNKITQEGRTPLHLAAINGHSKICKMLLTAGADINRQDERGFSTLHFSALKGNESVCELLLIENASVNISNHSGDTPLHIAAFNGVSKYCELLLSAGADINIQNLAGESPLYNACKQDNVSVCKLLLREDALARTITCNGETALHIAALNGHTHICKILLSAGLEVNGQDHKGNSSLHNAARRGNASLCELFLNEGANVELKNAEGRTPVHEVIDLVIARNKHQRPGQETLHCKELLKYFIFWGAKWDPFFLRKSTMGGIFLYDFRVIINLEIQTRCAGLPLESFNPCFEHTDYFKLCSEEIAKMKLTKEKGFSLYSVISNPLFVPNSAQEVMLHSQILQSAFPIYHRMLQVRFSRAKVRKTLLGKACERFRVEENLPEEVVRNIMSSLSNTDLSSVASC